MNPRFLIVLTIANFALLLFLLTRIHPVEAQSVATVLRGRAFEIVDDRGRVRASIQVQPASKMPNGETHPET
jgi:hypothetical protein